MRLLHLLDRLVTSRITLGLVLFAALALLIWYGGPKLAIDGAQPLASETHRLIAIAVLAALFLLLEALRRWRLHRLNRRILSSLGRIDGAPDAQDGVGRVREGYAMLCEALRMNGGRRLRDRRHLYDQPWYLVLGEPGSGRSAALANSGLEFVLDRGSLKRSAGSVPGRGGECGWWVTDDAVFVVAPGEFVSEPGPTQAAEWNDLLDCLKSARRRHPLNGIILTVAASCLPYEPAALEVATQMRRRVQEAMARLGMVLPIYLLVTKCDRIAGFSEYFSGLDARERARPLGIRLPLGATRPRPALGPPSAADTLAPGASAVAAYCERYGDFVAALEAWAPSRLEAERETHLRRRIFGFPQQMQALGEPLEAMVRCMFGPSRFRLAALFRGVFFSSARQQGPLTDIVLQVHRQVWSLAGAEPPAQALTRDTSFFLEGFFRDLVLSERGLPGRDPVARRRRLLSALGGFVLTGVVACGLGVSWWLGNADMQRQAGAISRAIADHRAMRAALPEDDFVEAALAVAPLGLAPPGPDDPAGSATGAGEWDAALRRRAHRLATHAGRLMLRTPADLSERMDGAYRAAARSLVGPVVAGGLGDELRRLAGAEDGSLERLREVLALYLGLADTDRFDTTALLEWTARHARGRHPLSADAQSRIIAVVGDAFGEPRTVESIDPAAVAAARRRLRVPPGREIHARMKAAYPGTFPAITVAGEFDEPTARAFAPADAAASAPGVPGLLTEPGFYEYFLPNAPGAIRDYRTNDWLDEQAAAAVSDDMVFADLGALYARDYIAAWNGFLARIALREVSTADQALGLMESLLSNDSPLDALVRLVSEHTVLPVVRGSNESAAQSDAGGAATEGGALASLRGEAEEAIGGRYGTWPGDEVRRAFARYHALHSGRNGDLPGLVDIRSRLGELHAVMATVDGESDRPAAAFREVRRWIDDPRGAEVSGLRRVAMVQPDPLRRMLLELSDRSVAILMRSARRHLDRRWRDTVSEECRRAVAGRYPLDRAAATAIAPDDFEAFFATGGTVDRFFEEEMGPFVEIAGGAWDERGIHGRRIGFRDAALEMIRSAIAIRDAFGLHAAGLEDAGFTIEPVYLDSQALWITVETNHRAFSYRHEPPRRFRMAFAEEAVSISVTDRAGAAHVSRVNAPWAWFRMFDRFRLVSSGVPDQHDFTVDVNGLDATFRVSADSTVNPLAPRVLTGFRCEERLL